MSNYSSKIRTSAETTVSWFWNISFTPGVRPLWRVSGRTGCSSCLGHTSWANTWGRSSEVGTQSVHPLLGLLSAGIGPHQQEVFAMYGHLRADCLNNPVYSSSPTSMQGHRVQIGGGQNKHLSYSHIQSCWIPQFLTHIWQTSHHQHDCFVLDISDPLK